MRKLADLIVHQGNVRGIHRNIASHPSHGNPHMGHFQGRRVIDAVSHHADRHPGRLTAADPFHLILRQTFRMNRMDSQLAGNVLRRVFMIPCQQHRLHMHGGKLSNHLPGFRPQRIRQRQNPFQGSVHRQVNDGTTLFQILLSRFRRLPVRCKLLFCHHLQVSCQHLLIPDSGFYPSSRDHLKGAGLGNLIFFCHRLCFAVRKCVPRFSVLFKASHHRFPKRMFGTQLCCGCHFQQLLLRVFSCEAYHIRHPGGSTGQSTSLVKTYPGHTGQPLQSVPFPHQKSVLCGISYGCHNCRGGGQHQRTGAEYHQNGHGPDDFTGHQPGQPGSAQRNHHNPGGPPVRQSYDLRLACIGGLHQADHPLDGAVLPHPAGLHIKRSKLIHRTAADLVSGLLVHRQRFPCHHRLIDGCLSADDHTVHRHGLSRQYPQKIPHLNLLGRYGLFPRPCQSPGRSGCQMNKFFDTRPGPGHRQILQQPSQLHDKRHLSGSEILADNHRCDQRQRYQHIRFDVKGCHQTDHRFQNNRYSTQNNGRPCRVERQRDQVKNADNQGNPTQHQTDNFPFDASPLQKSFQIFHMTSSLIPIPVYPYYTYRGIGMSRV